MKKIYLLVLVAFFFAGFNTLVAQVTVTATSGTLTGTYTTLKGAFDKINDGTHKGSILIEISASTNEGATPATLLSGDADPTNYSDILIMPTADAVSVSGNPASGFGVVQLNGADNVTIMGDNLNTAGTNKDLSIVNTAAAATGYTSCLRVATLAGNSASADNIFILNCNFVGNVTAGNASGITATTSSSNTSFGLYFGGKGSATTTLGAITSETADAALSGTTMNNIVIDNISVNQCGRGIVFNGAVPAVCSGLSISNSIIGAAAAISGYPVTTPATTVYTKGIWIAGADGITVTLNTIQNIISYVGTVAAGIELASNIGTGLISIDNNTINGVINNGTGATANGILVSSTGNKFAVSSNTVSQVQGSQASSASPVAGINVATAGGLAEVSKNNVSGVYNRNIGGYGAAGIYFSIAANGSEISNNFVSDIVNVGNSSFTTTTENATGILIGNGSSHKIYHNSVNLYGASPATSTNVVSCFTVSSSASTSLDIRNNLFSNTVTSGLGTNAHVCMYFPFTSAAASGYIINNNAYYTGATAGLHGVAFAGASTYNVANLYTVAAFDPYTTTAATNFRNWSSAAGTQNNDFASFGSTAAAPFVSATNLHIVAGATQLESGGVSTIIASDIDGAARASFPDIGADEFAGTKVDLTAPLITYTPLTGSCVLGNRTLTVNIIDPNGVPTSGAGLPVLYWRINAGAYAPVTGVSLGGGNYSFTFGAGAVVPDVVSYYIVAQDGTGTPNVISAPSAGASGFTANIPAAATPPATPESYLVQNNLPPGTYNVGAAQVYPTLTAAIAAYNNSCLSGPVIFQLTDATYSGSETFPISIGNPVASAVNTLTIRPAAGVNATITGSNAEALIKFNGADYVTIDGSNNGTNSQNLTITNTNTGTSSAVIWMASASATNGATHNVIKNCTVTGNATTTTFAGIVSCRGTAIGAGAGFEAATSNSFNTYQNVSVHTAFRGIALTGAAAGDNNDTVTNCKIGSTNAAEKIGFRGIYVYNQTNVIITNNQVYGISATSNNSINDVTAGISVRGAISNGVISSNIISDIKNITSGAWTAHGITLQSTTSNTGMSIFNNFIYDIAGLGYNSRVQDNGMGIGILTGGGYKVYYNSISINTNQINGSGISAAIFIDNRPTATELGIGSTPVSLNIRNNIFSNTQTGGTRYAIYSVAPSSSFTAIDYNDYYNTGTNLGFLASARLNLAAWQTATGQDANSVSVNPQFTSATNLHLLGSSTLNDLGTPIAGFTTDIDVDTRNITTPDIGADEFTPPNCNLATPGTVSASTSTICVSGNVVLSSTGFAFGTGIGYQWESSPNNAYPWTAISGETNPSTATVALSTTTYYRLKVTCSISGAIDSSASVLVTVNSPSVVSSAGGSVCGLGTVNLTATGSGGTTLRWFDVLSGGLPLATGSPYVTPAISTTTNYYVEAVAGITTGSVGPVSPTAQGGTIGTQTVSWDVGFDVIQATTLVSVDVYPIAAGGSGTLNVYNSAGTILISVPYTYTVSGGTTPQTIPINIFLPAGTGYYIEDPALFLPGSGATRNTSGATYPYTSSAINITGNGFDQTYFMCYYNWQFTSGCASAPRTTVVATVSSPPAYTHPATAPGSAICQGLGSVNITGADADYSLYSWSPAAGLSNAAIANPVATPTTTTLYTVTVSNGVCATSDTLTITVNPTPNAVTIAPAGPVAFCAGAPAQQLTASGGSGDLFRERFETTPFTKFAVSDNRISATQNSTYYIEATRSVRLQPLNHNISDASPSAYEMVNNINLSQYSNSVLTFYHIAAFEATFDFGYVEYSIDNGTNWVPFPTSSYTGSATLKNGVVSFDRSSYADWNTTFTSAGATPGAGPATSLWKLETIDLAPWQSNTQFKIRFRIKTDVSELYYGWLLDDVKINSSGTLTWSPVTDLFTDAAATIPYVANTNAPIVYTKPTASRLYTATAQFGSCPSSSTVQVNLTNNAISLTISSAQGTINICGADTVDLSITAQNIQGSPTPFYDWKKNGTTITGSATGGSSSGVTVTVASTATLFPGMRVNVTAGTGFFNANTRIVNILSPTQFTVSAAPGIALSGATISATASGQTVTDLRYADLANGDVITCVLSVGGVSCVPVNPVTSNTLTFTILPTTPASVSIVASANPVCATLPVTFTATPTNGGAAPTYEWFVNNVSQGAPAASNTFITSSLTNGQVVKCRMYSNASNCPFPKAPYSSDITMTVDPSFPVSVTITSSPAPAGSTVSICSGTSVTFTATPTNGGVTPTYEWLLNGSPAPGGTNSTTYTTVALSDLDVVSVKLTSSLASCALNNPDTSNLLDISVTTQVASVTITPSPNDTTCAGTSVTYTAVPVNGGVTPTYQWYRNAIPTVTTATYTVTPNDGDVISVDMYSSLSCATPIPATATLTQKVWDAPTASITGTNTICTSSPASMSATATAGSGTISTYQWTLQPATNVGTNSPNYTTWTAGSYTVTVTNSNGCSVTSAPFGPITSSFATALAGPYTIGSVTATASGASAGTTVNVASTAGLVVGQAVSVSSGTGVLANGIYNATAAAAGTTITVANTIGLQVGQTVSVLTGPATGVFANGTTITGGITATTFNVSAAPTTAIAAGAVIGANTIVSSITNGTQFVVAPAPTTALAAGATVTGATCTNFINFLFAITNLNIRSISAACTFDVPTGYVENLTAKLPALGNATLNLAASTRTLTFQKNGAGTSPRINAYTGGTGLANSAAPDGIFTIAGIDNVTIDGIDLQENASNVTAATQMEYGYGLFKLAAGDGVQNNTIKNCIITLNRANNNTATAPMVEGSVGILVINSTPTAATTVLTPTNGGTVNTNGSNSTNKFYTNTIQNCNYGIALSGYAATGGGPTPTATSFLGDIGNDVGGAVLADGNTILNFGGGGANAAAGIRALNQWSINIQYNNLNSNNGSGANHAGNLRGIFGETGTSANATISNNTISLKTAATAGTWTGIDNIIGSTAAANTININNNTIQNCSYSGASSPLFLGISNTATAANANINSNTISTIAIFNTGVSVLINNTATGMANCSISNNSISIVTNAAASGTLRGISVGNAVTGTFNTNTIDGMSFTAAVSTGSIDGIISTGTGQSNTFNGNIIRNLSIPAAGTINGIRENGSSTGTKTIQNNQIYNFSTTTGGAGGATFNGILANLGTTYNISGNEIYALISTGVTGGTAGVLAGIQTTGSTTVANVFTVSKNKIYNISSNSTGPVVYGMLFAGPTSLPSQPQTITASNNFIADLKTPFANVADAIRGLAVTNPHNAGSTYNIYYNSISINASSTGATFGTSGIYHFANTTATSASLNLRNNIIHNTSARNGATGFTVAFRRSAAALNNYAATSNNNLYFAGTPTSATKLIYFDGTNSDQSITAYQSRVAARDALSVSDSVSFVSATDLHVLAADNCAINGGAGPIAGFADDIDADTRNAVTPDIGADEFTGTGTSGQWAGVNTNWNDPINWCGGVPTATTSVIIPSPVPNYPVIPSGTAAVALNIQINSGANITTTGTGSLDIKGLLTNNGVLNNWGEVILSGSGAQQFPAAVSTGTFNAMTRLTINNAAGVTINRDLLIREAITPTAGTVTLNNVYVTLRSVDDTTARIGVVGGSFAYNGTGNFVVERFFPMKRTWRLITAPVVKTFVRSVFNSWQAGGNNSISGNATYVTGPSANPSTNGLDISPSNNYSLKRFDYTTSGFPGIGNTKQASIPAFPAGASASYLTDTTGYFMFVRGDRTPANIQPFNPWSQVGNITVLRDTGNIKTGSFVHNCNPTPTLNLNFSLIGNPYASAVDFKLLTRNATVANKFRVWDPTINTVGAWVVRDYSVNPAGINDVPSTNVTDTIRSSQAFVVETTGASPAPTVTFTEAAKLTSPVSSLLFRPIPIPASSLTTSLYLVNPDGTDQLADGVLAQFNDDYSIGNDYLDAVKFTNVNETFCIRSNNNYFAIERRPFLNSTDTLWFNFARARQFKYKFRVSIDNIIRSRNRIAYLHDKFLGTATPLNMRGNTWVNFEVTGNAASFAADRFFITFKKVARFHSIGADALYSNAIINWSVENAALVNHYEIERSVDGKDFEKVGELNAKENGDILCHYSITDPSLAEGEYYYRVKAVSNDDYAANDYSDMVKVKVMREKGNLYVFPNPVTNGKIGLKMNAASLEGKYAVRLVSESGQAVSLQQFLHTKSVQAHLISYPAYLAAGPYQLEVIGPDKKKTVIAIAIAAK